MGATEAEANTRARQEASMADFERLKPCGVALILPRWSGWFTAGRSH